MLFYKPQGAVSTEFSMLAADTFLLVLMTSFQAKIFEEFCGELGTQIFCWVNVKNNML